MIKCVCVTCILTCFNNLNKTQTVSLIGNWHEIIKCDLRKLYFGVKLKVPKLDVTTF